MRRVHAGRSCCAEALSERISNVSPAASLSSARVRRISSLSAAERCFASSLLREELEFINRIKQSAITSELRTDPSFQTFHLEDLSLDRFVVVHRKERVRPLLVSLLVLLVTNRKITVAVLR